MTDKLAFSPDEAALRAGICRSRIFSEIKNGKLEARKFGNRTLITAGALTAWLEALPTRSAVTNVAA
jgi:excisionase family DNA binding protein